MRGGTRHVRVRYTRLRNQATQSLTFFYREETTNRRNNKQQHATELTGCSVFLPRDTKAASVIPSICCNRVIKGRKNVARRFFTDASTCTCTVSPSFRLSLKLSRVCPTLSKPSSMNMPGRLISDPAVMMCVNKSVSER